MHVGKITVLVMMSLFAVVACTQHGSSTLDTTADAAALRAADDAVNHACDLGDETVRRYTPKTRCSCPRANPSSGVAMLFANTIDHPSPPTERPESVVRRFCRTALSGYPMISAGRRVQARLLGPGAL